MVNLNYGDFSRFWFLQNTQNLTQEKSQQNVEILPQLLYIKFYPS